MSKTNLKTKVILAVVLAALPLIMQSVLPDGGAGLPGFGMSGLGIDLFDLLDLPIGPS